MPENEKPDKMLRYLSTYTPTLSNLFIHTLSLSISLHTPPSISLHTHPARPLSIYLQTHSISLHTYPLSLSLNIHPLSLYLSTYTHSLSISIHIHPLSLSLYIHILFSLPIPSFLFILAQFYLLPIVYCLWEKHADMNVIINNW